MQNRVIILSVVFGVLALIVVAVGAFWGGSRYQSSKDANQSNQTQTTVYSSSLLPIAAGSEIGTGTVTGTTPTSLTLKLNSGQTYVFALVGATYLVRRVDSATEPLKVGDRVTVVAQKNAQSGFTAQYVQVYSAK
ncbi:hypothetical protein KGQ71_00415 [Patescibacteria group bacterium]|nr:hypothetical protein [Patescibacteria group bacterium]